MNVFRQFLIAAIFALAGFTANAQTSPPWNPGALPTGENWKKFWATKQDTLPGGVTPAASGANSDITSNGLVSFYAANFGSCTWDATHDVQPCIAAAIAAANTSPGGGNVILPAGSFGIATTLMQPYSNIHLIGNGVGEPRDNFAFFHPGTRLVWIGAAAAAFTGDSAGTTSLTVSSPTGGPISVGEYLGAGGGAGIPAGTKIVAQVSGTTGGAGVYTTNNATTLTAAAMQAGGVVFDSEPSDQVSIYNADVTGIVFDCANVASVCAVIKSNSFSNIDIGYSEPLITGAYYVAAAITDSPGSQGAYQLSIRGRQTSTTSTAAGSWLDSDLGSTWNLSGNLLNVSLFAWYGAGDGIVLGNTDNDTIASMSAFKQPGVGSYGTSCVIADNSYKSKNGWIVNGNSRSDVVMHNDCPDMQIKGPNASGFAKDIVVMFTDAENNIPDPVYGAYATGYYNRTNNPDFSPGNAASAVLNAGFQNVIGGSTWSIALGYQNHVAGSFPVAIGFGAYALNGYAFALGLDVHSNGYGTWTRGENATDFNNTGFDCFSTGKISTTGDDEACQTVLHGTGSGGGAIRATSNGAVAGTVNIIDIPSNTGVSFDISLEAVDRTDSTKRYTARWNQAHELYRGSTLASAVIDGGTASVAPDYFRRVGFSSGETMSLTPDITFGGMNFSFTPPNSDTWDVVARVSMTITQ